jgi:branched-chain amino acid transport system permease protein
VKGAFVAALLVGLLDTFGRVLLPEIVGSAAGTALASMVIYIVVACVLVLKPSGLFPART